MMRKSRYLPRLLCLMLILVLGFSVSTLPAQPVEAVYENYRRAGNYLILQLDTKKVLQAVDRIGNGKFILTSGATYYLRDNLDRQREYQTFHGKLYVFNLKNPKQLYREAFVDDAFATGLWLDPGRYTVQGKIFNMLHVKLASGQEGYIQVALNDLDSHVADDGQFVGAPAVVKRMDNLPVKTLMKAFSRRPAAPNVVQYVTIHNTASTGHGGTANAHARYVSRSDRPLQAASFQYVVDQNEVWQMIPLNEAAYHAGDNWNFGNGSTIGIEICENSYGRYYATAERNAAKLTAQILYDLGLPADRIRRHFDWSGKNCPHVWTDYAYPTLGYSGFKKEVARIYDTLVKKHGPAKSPILASAKPLGTERGYVDPAPEPPPVTPTPQPPTDALKPQTFNDPEFTAFLQANRLVVYQDVITGFGLNQAIGKLVAVPAQVSSGGSSAVTDGLDESALTAASAAATGSSIPTAATAASAPATPSVPAPAVTTATSDTTAVTTELTSLAATAAATTTPPAATAPATTVTTGAATTAMTTPATTVPVTTTRPSVTAPATSATVPATTVTAPVTSDTVPATTAAAPATTAGTTAVTTAPTPTPSPAPAPLLRATFTTRDGTAKTAGPIRTGDRLTFKSSLRTYTFPVAVKGDIDGDGEITLVDLVLVERHLIDYARLKGAELIAASVNEQNHISLVDLVLIERDLIDYAKIHKQE